MQKSDVYLKPRDLGKPLRCGVLAYSRFSRRSHFCGLLSMARTLYTAAFRGQRPVCIIEIRKKLGGPERDSPVPLDLGKPRPVSERGPPPSGRALTLVTLVAGQPNAWRRRSVSGGQYRRDVSPLWGRPEPPTLFQKRVPRLRLTETGRLSG